MSIANGAVLLERKKCDRLVATMQPRPWISCPALPGKAAVWVRGKRLSFMQAHRLRELRGRFNRSSRSPGGSQGLGRSQRAGVKVEKKPKWGIGPLGRVAVQLPVHTHTSFTGPHPRTWAGTAKTDLQAPVMQYSPRVTMSTIPGRRKASSSARDYPFLTRSVHRGFFGTTQFSSEGTFSFSLHTVIPRQRHIFILYAVSPPTPSRFGHCFTAPSQDISGVTPPSTLHQR